jgi:hypothetical protein
MQNEENKQVINADESSTSQNHTPPTQRKGNKRAASDDDADEPSSDLDGKASARRVISKAMSTQAEDSNSLFEKKRYISKRCSHRER